MLTYRLTLAFTFYCFLLAPFLSFYTDSVLESKPAKGKGSRGGGGGGGGGSKSTSAGPQ